MLRIGVELPLALATAGEFLADVQAYEAAGADAIWLGAPDADPPGFEPLTLLAAAAVVTARARLAATVRAGSPWPAALLANVVTTLVELSRGRVVVGLDMVEGDVPPHPTPGDPHPTTAISRGPRVRPVDGPPRPQGGRDELVGVLRAAGATVFVSDAGSAEAPVSLALRGADGIVSTGTAADELAARFQQVRGLESESGAASEPELWVRVPAPTGRAAWRELLTVHEAAGATGVIVTHAPNLLDILRNPEEDDRQDLAMAIG